MSRMDSTGQQYDLALATDPEDAWALVRAVMHDKRVLEKERVRTTWTGLDAAHFGCQRSRIEHQAHG